MQIVVASGNIFRRELSVYVLSEAGHHVGEVRDAAAMIDLVAAANPQLIMVDVLLARGDPGSLHSQVRERSQAPILWLTHSAGDALALPDAPGDDWVIWPYNPDELLRQIDRLAAPARGTSDRLAQPLSQRYAGDHS